MPVTQIISSVPPVLTRSRVTSLARYLPVLPALAFLSVFFIAPLVVTGFQSLTGNVLISFQGISDRNYTYLLSKVFYWNVVLRTLRLAVLATLLALLLGYPTGLLLRKAGKARTGIAFATLTFPILAGPLVVILGWMALLSDGGPLLRPLSTLGLIGPLHLIGTETAIIISMVHFILPFVVLTLHATFRQIADSALEAAASLGATRLQILRHVIAPLSLPGLLSAAIIAFTLSAGSYVSPHYMGGATEATLATLVSDFVFGTYNMPMAASASMILIVTMAAATAVLTQILSRLARS